MNNKAKEHFMRNKTAYIFLFVFIVLVIGVSTLYGLGYRFKNNLTLGKIGYVEITIPMPLTSIFIDESKKIVTDRDNQAIKLSFTPRGHSIIISKDGYYPWKKDFTVPSKGLVILKPIFVSVNASGEIINKIDPEYWKLRNMIITDPLPTKNTAKVSSDGSTKIWIENSGIIAQTGSTTVGVIQTDTAIRNISFYKKRSDAVVFSTGNTIYVIEIAPTGEQNFMPIYKGVKPSFVANDPNFIYVLDGENLMQVII